MAFDEKRMQAIKQVIDTLKKLAGESPQDIMNVLIATGAWVSLGVSDPRNQLPTHVRAGILGGLVEVFLDQYEAELRASDEKAKKAAAVETKESVQ